MMRKYIKKALCIVMALVLTMSLCACSTDPNCGSYVCKTVTVGDITVNVNEAFVNGASLELKQAGACDVVLDGKKYEGSWKSEGSQVTITLEEEPSVGTISGNTISIDIFDIGMTLIFEKN